MPKSPKPPAPKGVPVDLSDVQRRSGKRPRFDPRTLKSAKGERSGKQRGGRPPRFPGRTGGR